MAGNVNSTPSDFIYEFDNGSFLPGNAIGTMGAAGIA